MTVLIIFAFLSGIITILSPCILPVLPIVLSGSVGGGKGRAAGVVSGFVIVFTIFTLTLTALVQALGIPSDALRIVAVIIIVLFGAVLLVPKLREWFELISSRIARMGGTRNSGDRKRPERRKGFAGVGQGLALGASLGLVWTPCVGPIMAGVIALALTKHVDNGAVFITLSYAIGTALPMFGVMIGGRALLAKVPALTRNTGTIQKVFGVLMIVIGISIFFGWDRQFQTAVLTLFPGYGTGLTAIENAKPVREALAKRNFANSSSNNNDKRFAPGDEPSAGRLSDYGIAPEITTTGSWFNLDLKGIPASQTEKQKRISMSDFKGKVVLIDFWTYSCINCIRTIPILRKWYETYGRSGLVILGVHTPEFEFEKSKTNVEKAISDLGVSWPVVQDNDYLQWNAYSNTYWPAHYFIDANGHVRYFHFGEGEYDIAEGVIRTLLAEGGNAIATLGTIDAPVIRAATPETYLGYARMKGFTSAQDFLPNKTIDYSSGSRPRNGEWGLLGKWTITKEYVYPETEGTLELGFNAMNVFLVIEPFGTNGQVAVTLDGKAAPDTKDVKNGMLAPSESRLYTLVSLASGGEHRLELRVRGNLRLFSFTFG